MGSSVKHIAQLIKPISVKFKKGLTLFDVYEVRTGIFISTLKLGTNGLTCLPSKAGVIKFLVSISDTNSAHLSVKLTPFSSAEFHISYNYKNFTDAEQKLDRYLRLLKLFQVPSLVSYLIRSN